MGYVFFPNNIVYLKLWYFMRTTITISAELRDLLSAAAAETNSSLNGYIITAIEERLRKQGYRLPRQRPQKRRARAPRGGVRTPTREGI